jgi:hypothetical protein
MPTHTAFREMADRPAVKSLQDNLASAFQEEAE